MCTLRNSHAGSDTGKLAGRSEVDVLVESPANRNQQTPQRYVIGHIGPANRAQEHGIGLRESINSIGRHHRAVLNKVIAPPINPFPGDALPGLLHGPIEYPNGCGQHFITDAIAWDCRDFQGAHFLWGVLN